MAIGMEAPSASVLGLTISAVALTKEALYLAGVWKTGLAAVVKGASAAFALAPPSFHVTWLLPHAAWTGLHALAFSTLFGQLADANGRVR